MLFFVIVFDSILDFFLQIKSNFLGPLADTQCICKVFGVLLLLLWLYPFMQFLLLNHRTFHHVRHICFLSPHSFGVMDRLRVILAVQTLLDSMGPHFLPIIFVDCHHCTLIINRLKCLLLLFVDDLELLVLRLAALGLLATVLIILAGLRGDL